MTKNELLSAYNKVLAENVELQKQLDWYKDYADRLVKHKDMVCLPADLKNLRESNLKLATENEELKKRVETLKGIITQAWFTNVEEKDKQIEYLLQKVNELSDPYEDLDEYED
jgi:predicted RNase H-like nuclease (RuvC/YqgF family)